MEFTTFLFYFFCSMLVWRISAILFKASLKFLIQWRLKKAIKSGKIKMMTMEDIINKIQDEKQEGGDGTWH